jgi:hypothetical protein
MALHPGEDITIDELKTVTIANVLTDDIYNDLGFIAKDKLIVLVECQSTWNWNMPLRLLLYYIETVRNDYIGKNLDKLYRTTPIAIPKPEMYVVYTGERTDKPQIIKFSDVYFPHMESDIEVAVHMLYGDDSRNIIDQYVKFAKTADETFKKMGRTNEAVIELIDECKQKDILREYLTGKESEVLTIMTTLFDQDKITESYGRDKYNTGLQVGLETGMETGKAEQLISSVETTMNFYNVSLEKACRGLGKTVDDYYNAKKLLESNKTFV